MSLFPNTFGIAAGALDAMLASAPLRIESGIERLPSGVVRVAVRTDLPNCKGRMLDWWFKEFDTNQHLLMWHPVDHVEHRAGTRSGARGRATSARRSAPSRALATSRRWPPSSASTIRARPSRPAPTMPPATAATRRLP